MPSANLARYGLESAFAAEVARTLCKCRQLPLCVRVQYLQQHGHGTDSPLLRPSSTHFPAGGSARACASDLCGMPDRVSAAAAAMMVARVKAFMYAVLCYLSVLYRSIGV